MPHVKHNSFSYEQKAAILKDIEKSSAGKVAKERNISRATIYKIVKEKHKILNVVNSTDFNSNKKRMRNGKYEDVEEALVLWASQASREGHPISGPILKEKAILLATEIGYDNFDCSNAWIARLKIRRSIVYDKCAYPQPRIANKEMVNESINESVEEWKENVLQNITQKFSTSDIFTVDETVLLYKLLPKEACTFKSAASSSGGLKATERLTLLIGYNMSGTEKLPLLIIGSEADPSCFDSYQKLKNYYHNSKALMTQDIFYEWLIDFNAKMSTANRKIALLLDTCPSHRNLILDSITLVFLPPEATKVMDPCDPEVIRSLKKLYRQNVITRCLFFNKQIKIDLASALCWLELAWDQVNLLTCIGHSNSSVEVKTQSSLEGLLKLLSAYNKGINITAQEYANIDETILTERVIADLATSTDSSKERCKDVSDTNNEDCQLQVPTFDEAYFCAAKLTKFFLANAPKHRQKAKEGLYEIEQFIVKCQFEEFKKKK